MAELSRKEFAALCHTTYGIVTTNVNRGNIVVNIDKKIDTENALNKQFFNKYQAKFLDEKKQYQQPKPQPEPKKEKKKKSKRKANTQVDIKSQQIVDDAARKKKADADLQEYRAAHEKLKMDKLAGKLIPVDLVFQILNIHNKSIFSTFQSDAENMASVYCEILAEGDRRKLAEITDKLSTVISDAVNKSKDLAEIELENAIAEYSQTLNRGQRR